MNAISAQERRLSVATPLAKLCRMLRSMSRSYPRGRLWRTPAGFGASLDEQTYIKVSYSGHWTADNMRDWLALFATWCVADPKYLFERGQRLDGVLLTVEQDCEQSNTQET